MLDTLNNRAISVSCLITWGGIFLGFGLLTVAELLGRTDLVRWGFAVLLVACTYSVHRHIEVQDERLRQAFEYGRDHERGAAANVSSIR